MTDQTEQDLKIVAQFKDNKLTPACLDKIAKGIALLSFGGSKSQNPAESKQTSKHFMAD